MKEQKYIFNKYVNKALYNLFKDKDKISLLEEKEENINIIINKITENKKEFIDYYKQNEEDLYYLIDKMYIKEYQKYLRESRLKQKAQKDKYTTLIYNEIVFDIEDSKHNLQDTIFFIKTMDYKKALFNDLKEETENFNEDLFNELYLKIRNKVLSEYKDQLEIEKAQEQTRQQQNNKIPLGWKMCALTEVVNKIMKI